MISQEQIELTNLLNESSRLYYAGEYTPISDTDFDLKLKELQRLERESGEVLPYSPTLRVGSDIQVGFSKIEHPFPMLTIDNTYSEGELSEWFEDVHSKYGVTSFNISVKYDGVSCELHYVDGILLSASTRGDKNVGDDITANVRTIKDVPLRLNGVGGDLYVRGEVMLPKSKLEAINEVRISNNEKPFANCRNATTGSVKQLDPKVTASRGLIFRAWDCFYIGNEGFDTMNEKFAFLSDCGFICESGTSPFSIEYTTGMECSNIVSSFYERIKSYSLDYDFDGVVIKVDSTGVQKSIGTKDTRSIEWGIARKWNEERTVFTKLNGVHWSVGVGGQVTPVGDLEPVACDGVIVSNVSLHNMSFINMHGLCYGDDVIITRSGGVIPYLVGVHSSNGGERVLYPQVCPVCGEPLVEFDGIVRCVNKDCSAQVLGKIVNFCSKDCMDIRSVGPAVIGDMLDKGIIKNYIDFCKLENCDINMLKEVMGTGYDVKKVSKIVSEIKNAKTKPLEKLICALGIKGIGKSNSRILAKEYGSLDKLSTASVYDLQCVEGIGEVVSNDIASFFRGDFGVACVEYFGNNGFSVIYESDDSESGSLNGMSVVFSGSSSRFKGDAIEEYLEKMGAKCSHSVTKKTNYLIIGEKPGSSKLKKAEEYGIEIISENDFYNKYNL